ncbi:MAG: HD-GYP domain-containing protein [Kiritimatiellia bacterium]|jgi:putative nucleotidyltransferase with HDIG domain
MTKKKRGGDAATSHKAAKFTPSPSEKPLMPNLTAALTAKETPAPELISPPIDIVAVMQDETLYDSRPHGMYKMAEHMGIDITINNHTVLKKAAACLGTVFRVISNDLTDKSILWPMAKSIASDLESIISTTNHVLTELPRPRLAAKHLIWHSIYTSILTMALARHTPGLPCSIQELGAAALLHDIGKLMVPDFFNSAPQENNADYQEHVIHSVDLARKLEAPDIVVTAILQHHEKLDGKGFPNRITGSKMLLISQMIAIANIFEQARFGQLLPTGEIVSTIPIGIPQLLEGYRGAFDDALLKKMAGIVGFYPNGSIVELSDRSVCKVIQQNDGYPLNPKVNVIVDANGNHQTSAIVDLSQTSTHSIIKIISYPISNQPTGSN